LNSGCFYIVWYFFFDIKNFQFYSSLITFHVLHDNTNYICWLLCLEEYRHANSEYGHVTHVHWNISHFKIRRPRFACENIICLVNDNSARLLVNNSIWGMFHVHVCVTERKRSIYCQDRILYSHRRRRNIYRMRFIYPRYHAVKFFETAAAARSLRNPDSQRPDQISFAIKKKKLK
jgi:hypothetical protein